jgi:hypothetical protein
VAGWVVGLAVVLLWPITRGGYLLGHDMVFTPKQPLDLQAIGVSSAPPRAVPLDALVALAERVANGAVVGRLALALPLLAAGLGAAAVLRRMPLPGRLAAATVALWNPYVVERLAIGQWALLWCYAALPWLLFAINCGRGRAGWLGRAGALAAASITPTGGVIAAVSAVALALGLRRGRREALATLALAVSLQLPWLVAAAVSSASATSDPAGVAAFAARAEHPGGALLSLLDGGGIWDSEVVPGSRAGALPWLWLALLVAAAGYGTPKLVELLGGRVVAILAGLAAAGLLLAVLPSIPGGAALARAAVEHLPGAGLLRDSQKWVLPLVTLEALLAGAAVARLTDRLAALPWRVALCVAGVAAPLIVLPDAAATLRPTVEPVHYPRDWSAVADAITGGDAAVVPWGSYRRFAWAPGRSVLDPGPRLLPVPTVVDDRLAVGGTVLRGEDPRAAGVGRALSSGPRLPSALAAQGIRWVVVEHGTPGEVPDLGGLQSVYQGDSVSLYRVPGEVARWSPSGGRVAAVLIADAVAASVLVGLVLDTLYDRFVRRRTRRKTRTTGAAPLI